MIEMEEKNWEENGREEKKVESSKKLCVDICAIVLSLEIGLLFKVHA